METVYLDYKKELSKRKIKKVAKKLYKISKKREIVIALSKKLEENEELIYEILNYGLQILNGRWLFKFLLIDILEYISKLKNQNLQNQTVAILIEQTDEIVMQQLVLIAHRVKILKIVTKNIKSFFYIENQLYKDYGIAIQLTSNKLKSLSNADIIINFDFTEDMLKEYNIKENTTIVNILKKINLKESEFCGININNYEIEYDEKNCEDKIGFEHNVLYESYIYRRDNFLNIRKQLELDRVRLVKLE